MLKVCEVEENAIVGIMLLLKEDEHCNKMIKWIDKNPNTMQQDILLQASRIRRQNLTSVTPEV